MWRDAESRPFMGDPKQRHTRMPTPKQIEDAAEFTRRCHAFDWRGLTREPFTMIVHGTPRSGKSYLLRWWLQQYAREYSIVVVFSISADSAGYYSQVGIEPSSVYQGFDVQSSRDLLTHMIDTANRHMRSAGGMRATEALPKTLIVCDDIISPGAQQHNFGALKSLVTNYRHLNMSLILTSQYINAVSTVMRDTVDYHIIFKHESARARDFFKDNCFAWVTYKPSVQLILDQHTGDHRCIVVNKRSESTTYTVFRAP
ncbi:hypothetical protein PAPYR_11450 [Paratrimastix pyriformis]|uniref:AAA+ ATPase domain-containing protein n=1 Tax=Paratrimastix pyriformis TaxID=342808 RepID=A0ABQ8U7W5_9EUKA|nr:hypothetical protein PAPYR_11450 [Paratrimastix pyriformis]